MARFFKNLNEEENDIKKKVDMISENKDKIVTEKDKKMDELNRRVNEILSSSKNMEKGTKKLFGDIKKFTKYFEKNKIPQCLFELVSDERILKFSSIKSLLKNFIKNYPKEEKLIFGGKLDENEEENSSLDNSSDDSKNKSIIYSNKGVETRKQRLEDNFEHKLESVMQIDCADEKERMLLDMFKARMAEEDRYRLMTVLFTFYKGLGDVEKMMWVLEESFKYFSVGGKEMNMLSGSVDFYIGLIYDKLREEDYDRYKQLLEKLEEINRESYMIRKLQFDFFKLSIDVDTRDRRFYLLHLVRQKDWEGAETYFLENEDFFMAEHNTRTEKTLNIEILKEFWKLGLERGGFITVFRVLEYFYKMGCSEVKLLLFALCVILNEKVKTSEVFIEFLRKFKSLNINKYMLKSENTEDEILRSFYLYNNCDYKASSEIIFNVTGINCTNYLKESVLRIIEKL